MVRLVHRANVAKNVPAVRYRESWSRTRMESCLGGMLAHLNTHMIIHGLRRSSMHKFFYNLVIPSDDCILIYLCNELLLICLEVSRWAILAATPI